MGNRADRRASAKIARQAAKRAKTPLESALLRAAGAFASDDGVGLLAPHLSDPGFDAAWLKLSDDLHDVLEERFPDFLMQAYIEAGIGETEDAGSGAAAGGVATRLFLCPVAGAPGRIETFLADGSPERLAASLREFGVVAESGRCLVPPIFVPIAAFAPPATGPGRVRALHDTLRDRLAAEIAGPAMQRSAQEWAALFPLPTEEAPAIASPAMRFGAFVGIEAFRPGPPSAPQDEDAEDLARAARLDSWHDSYAAEIDGLSIGPPLDWPACASALAWEKARTEIETALKVPTETPASIDVLHSGPSRDGRSLLLAAGFEGRTAGPFAVPAELAWLDAEAFFGRAEDGVKTLVEHEDERPVLAFLGSS